MYVDVKCILILGNIVRVIKYLEDLNIKIWNRSVIRYVKVLINKL